MNRRDTAIALLALGAAPLIARAQTPQHARVGWLYSGYVNQAVVLPLVESALRERGWVEGRNLTLERRFAEGRMERLPDLAAELVNLKVHVLVFANDTELAFARHSVHQIPIVVGSITDPIQMGFTTSLAHPTGNVTGCVYADPGLSAKVLQIQKELVPGIRRVAGIYPAETQIESFLKAAEAAGRQLGVTYYRYPVRTIEDIDAALADVKKKRIDALRIVDTGIVGAEEARILKFASLNSLPTTFSGPGPVERGGLLSYTPNLSARASRVAAFVDKILKGAKPADLPFEYPTRYDLVINLKTAKSLGITVPPSLLLRVDRVIE